VPRDQPESLRRSLAPRHQAVVHMTERKPPGQGALALDALDRHRQVPMVGPSPQAGRFPNPGRRGRGPRCSRPWGLRMGQQARGGPGSAAQGAGRDPIADPARDRPHTLHPHGKVELAAPALAGRRPPPRVQLASRSQRRQPNALTEVRSSGAGKLAAGGPSWPVSWLPRMQASAESSEARLVAIRFLAITEDPPNHQQGIGRQERSRATARDPPLPVQIPGMADAFCAVSTP